MFSTRCWEVNRTIIEPRGVYAGLCSKGLNIFPCHGRGGGWGGLKPDIKPQFSLHQGKYKLCVIPDDRILPKIKKFYSIASIYKLQLRAV